MQNTKLHGMNQILKVKFSKSYRNVIKKSSDINSVKGNEGTIIKQYFHPKDTKKDQLQSCSIYTRIWKKI